jgi:hypothetical protein
MEPQKSPPWRRPELSEWQKCTAAPAVAALENISWKSSMPTWGGRLVASHHRPPALYQIY